MGDEKDAFYVVRKGDVVGVYKSINDLQSVLRSSVNDHTVNVFKGYGLSKEAEGYLSSHGLKNAIYCVDSSDVRDDLFGQLINCPFREPNSSKDKSAGKNHLDKTPQEVVGSASFPLNPQITHGKLDNFLQVPPISSYCPSCILEFDGASKGNPGPAGAGAVLRVADGRVYRLREGVGIATNNVAEYRGAILGLKFAISKGFKHIRVQGDSKLVCMQVQGLWRTKTQNMTELCKVAKELKDQFMSFQICHVERVSSESMDTIGDIFESSLNFEETHVKEGYDEGYGDGLLTGKEEGRQVGLKTGFETGEELGFYRGCVDVWNSAIRADPNFTSARTQRTINQMDELLRKYPISEPENESVSDWMDSMRLKFRAVCASLNVRLEYDGYPKSSNSGNIEF